MCNGPLKFVMNDKVEMICGYSWENHGQRTLYVRGKRCNIKGCKGTYHSWLEKNYNLGSLRIW